MLGFGVKRKVFSLNQRVVRCLCLKGFIYKNLTEGYFCYANAKEWVQGISSLFDKCDGLKQSYIQDKGNECRMRIHRCFFKRITWNTCGSWSAVWDIFGIKDSLYNGCMLNLRSNYINCWTVCSLDQLYFLQGHLFYSWRRNMGLCGCALIIVSFIV